MRINYSDGSYYDGEISGDLFNGFGRLCIAGGDFYEGEFKNGEYYGKGVLMTPDGMRCEGEFKGGALCGKGVSVFPNGDRIDGTFKDGLPEGRCKVFFADGSVIEAMFKEGVMVEDAPAPQPTAENVPSSSGAFVPDLSLGDAKPRESEKKYKGFGYTGKDMNTVSGEENKRTYQGFGYTGSDMNTGTGATKPSVDFTHEGISAGAKTMDAPDSSEGIRVRKNNADAINAAASLLGGKSSNNPFADLKKKLEDEKKPKERGTFIYSGGQRYEGEMENGLPNGIGVIYLNDGRYEGAVVNGNITGRGTLYNNNGTVLECDFVNGMACGVGSTTIANGTKYEGEYKNGVFNGNGTLTTSQGVVIKGPFVDGSPHGVCHVDSPTTGHHIIEYENGNVKRIIE